MSGSGEADRSVRGSVSAGRELAQELEERFLGLAENSPSMIFINQGGRVVYANPRAEEILGYSVAELCAPDFDFRRLVAPEHLEMVGQALARHLAGHEVPQYEYGLITRDGRRVDAINATRLIRYHGAPAILGVVTDVSALVAARRALEESEQIYRALVESSPDSISMFDFDGRILMVNQEAARQQGFATPAELLSSGRAAFDTLADEDRQAVQADLLRLLEQGTVRGSRFAVELPGGRRSLREANATLLTDAEGRPRAVIAVTRDITDRVRAEEERLHLERQMLHAQKLESLGILAGGIAHDFNNLLTGILGSANLALDKLAPTDPACKDVRRIEIAAQRAAALTHEMLAYSGRSTVTKELVRVQDLSREITQLLAASIPKKVGLAYVLDPDLPPVRADPGQLQQVIMNLITNAAEAIGTAEGTITVRARVGPADASDPDLVGADHELGEGDYLHLEVSDTGCGMDADTMSRIFDPFFSTKVAGRGLGLAAVLGIVRGHGGALALSSEVGVGTTIRVLLPTSEPLAVEVAHGQPQRAGQRGGTVLVVDDEPLVREVAAAMLASLGAEVLLACDGHQALEVFEAHVDRIDAVLLDCTMPGLDGEEVLERLRQLRGDIPVILTSGFDENDAAGSCVGAGPTTFLKKPYSLDDLAWAWASANRR